MPTTSAVTLAASAARTASAEGAAVDLGLKTTVELLLNVTAASGTTPTLAVVLQTSRDGSTGWTEVVPLDDGGTDVRFTTKTTIGSQRLTFPGCDRYVRAVWTIAGAAASFTFSIAGTAILVYCTPADVTQLGLPQDALSGVGSAWIDRSARSTTDVANSYIGKQNGLPLTVIDDALRRACAAMTAADVMITRGLEPDKQETLLFGRADAALAWLKEIAKGDAVLDGTTDATPDEEEGGVYAYTDVRRGW